MDRHRLYLPIDLMPGMVWEDLVDHLEPVIRAVDPHVRMDDIRRTPDVHGARSVAGKEYLILLRPSDDGSFQTLTIETSGEVSPSYPDKVAQFLVFLNPFVVRAGKTRFCNMGIPYGVSGHHQTLVWGATEADRVGVLVPSFLADPHHFPTEGLEPAYRGYPHDTNAVAAKTLRLQSDIKVALQRVQETILQKALIDTQRQPLCGTATNTHETQDCLEEVGPR